MTRTRTSRTSTGVTRSSTRRSSAPSTRTPQRSDKTSSAVHSTPRHPPSPHPPSPLPSPLEPVPSPLCPHPLPSPPTHHPSAPDSAQARHCEPHRIALSCSLLHARYACVHGPVLAGARLSSRSAVRCASQGASSCRSSLHVCPRFLYLVPNLFIFQEFFRFSNILIMKEVSLSGRGAIRNFRGLATRD